jgi:hypothetical protein
VETAAQAVKGQLVLLDVNNDRDTEAAFPILVRRGADALPVGSGGFLNSNRKRIVALARGHALPSAHAQREAVDGALMGYGARRFTRSCTSSATRKAPISSSSAFPLRQHEPLRKPRRRGRYPRAPELIVANQNVLSPL